MPAPATSRDLRFLDPAVLSRLGTMELKARTVVEGLAEKAALIDDLESRHPGLRNRLVDGEGLRRFVNVYLNDEDVRFLEGLKTPVSDGDTVTVLPAVAGGSIRR